MVRYHTLVQRKTMKMNDLLDLFVNKTYFPLIASQR